MSYDIIKDKILKDKIEYNINYEHGISHGIGYISNIHENYYIENNKFIVKENMLISNEPGHYIKDKYGIRIERDILSLKNKDNKIYFENVSLVPYDINLIEIEMLTDNEINYINFYHIECYNKLIKYIKNEDLRIYLKEITKLILKN